MFAFFASMVGRVQIKHFPNYITKPLTGQWIYGKVKENLQKVCFVGCSEDLSGFWEQLTKHYSLI